MNVNARIVAEIDAIGELNETPEVVEVSYATALPSHYWMSKREQWLIVNEI